MKTVFVLVDALKSLYLTEENMPFLYSLSKKGYYIKQIIPCAGFCERSEIFSGLDGYDTGNFSAIGYMPESSPYRGNERLLTIFDFISKISTRVSQRLFSRWRIINRKPLNKYRIPFKSLKNFALTEDGEKRLIPHRDIFQVLKENGLTYTLDGFTSLSDIGRRTHLSVTELAKREIDKKTDFVPLYIGETDSIGHKCGSDIDGIKPTLKSVDEKLHDIYIMANSAGYSFCVMGDHGMVPVTKKIDIMYFIQATGCRLHKDYETFLDSTMARFWFNNKETEKRIVSTLENSVSEYGFIVNKENCAKYRIPLDVVNRDGKPVYGDIVWCANPGVLVSPDYFHAASASENGMHGYIEVVEGEGTGLFVEMNPIITPQGLEQAHSSQICGELCKSLGINKPNSDQWKRIV